MILATIEDCLCSVLSSSQPSKFISNPFPSLSENHLATSETLGLLYTNRSVSVVAVAILLFLKGQ